MEPTLEPTRAELERVVRAKHRDLDRAGWGPRTRFAFGYFTPDEYYAAVVARLVRPGCAWLDVGGGRDVLPDNRALAKELAGRCRELVVVDPSDTVEENPIAARRVRARLEDFVSDERFDLATLRMVAEHVEHPEAFVAALARLLKPGGVAVVYTVDRWSPVSVASWLTRLSAHRRAKRFLWATEERDTYPVNYRMNTPRRLRQLFGRAGFSEEFFARLDDCRTFHRFRVLHYLELSSWQFLRALGLHYPETCLLGVYRRQS